MKNSFQNAFISLALLTAITTACTVQKGQVTNKICECLKLESNEERQSCMQKLSKEVKNKEEMKKHKEEIMKMVKENCPEHADKLQEFKRREEEVSQP